MRWQSLLLAEKVPNLVRRMRWKGHISLRCLWQCGSVFHKASAQQGSTRGKARLVRNPAAFWQQHPQSQSLQSIAQQGSARGQDPPRMKSGYLFAF